MNPQEEQKKEAITKGLAVVGFATGILLLVWLAVQAVGLLPSAFQSLASLADSVYNYDNTPTLEVSSDRTVVNSGESFDVSWEPIATPGTFAFRYDCTNGASVNVRQDGEVIELQCGDNLDLTTTDQVELQIRTEQRRFIDVPYTVSFSPENATIDNVSTDGVITIVNASIPAGSTAAETEDSTDETDTTSVAVTPEPVVAIDPEPTPAPTTPAPSDPIPAAPVTPPAPQYVETITYQVPVSDPDGFVDLAVQFAGVGIYDEAFVFRGEIPTDEAGAIRFTVQNRGNKTSDDWQFITNLPSDIAYTSDVQAPLQPNEIATIVVAFDGIKRTGLESFDVTIDTDEDRDTTNNDFSWSVRVVE